MAYEGQAPSGDKAQHMPTARWAFQTGANTAHGRWMGFKKPLLGAGLRIAAEGDLKGFAQVRTRLTGQVIARMGDF